MSGIISARLVSRSCYARRAKATRQPGKRSSIVSSVSSGLPHALTGWRPPTPPMSSRSHGCASWRTWTASTIPSDSAGGSLLPRDASAFASSAYAGASSLPRRPAYSTDRSTTQSRVRSSPPNEIGRYAGRSAALTNDVKPSCGCSPPQTLRAMRRSERRSAWQSARSGPHAGDAWKSSAAAQSSLNLNYGNHRMTPRPEA